MSITLTDQRTIGCPHPLARVRATRGWSQRQLADLLQRLALKQRINLATGQNRVWRWERYGTVPDEQTQLLLAQLLDLPSEMVRARPGPHWLPAWEGACFLFPWSPDGTRQALEEACDSVRTDDRGFVDITGLRLTGLAHEWQLAAVEPLETTSRGRPVDAELVHWIEERTGHLRRIDDTLGGEELQLLVQEELRLVTALLRHGSYTAGVGRRLFTVAAELAQLAGWVSFDADSQSAAQRYYITALHAAHTAGDRPLGAYVLACMSYQLAHVGCTHDAVQLALCAREGSGPATPRRVTTLLHLRLAYAHAVAGELRASVQAVDSAGEARTSPGTSDGSEPRWLYWLNHAHVDAIRGRCLSLAGRPVDAAALLQPAIEAERPSFTRDAIVHLTWLAQAHLSRNDPGPACGALREAWTLADYVASPRTAGLVRAFRRTLAPHSAVPAAGELRQLLATTRTIAPAPATTRTKAPRSMP